MLSSSPRGCPGVTAAHPAPRLLSGNSIATAELNKPVSSLASVTSSAGPWNSHFCPGTTNCLHAVLPASRGCGVAQPGRDAAVHKALWEMGPQGRDLCLSFLCPHSLQRWEGTSHRRHLYFMARCCRTFLQCSSEPSTCNVEETKRKIFLTPADQEKLKQRETRERF